MASQQSQPQGQRGFFVTGTDTNVGKTVAATWLTLHLKGEYWKPVQCGDLKYGGDTRTVQNLTAFPPNRIHKPAYEFKAPLSPHEAAHREGKSIDLAKIKMPHTERPLIVEGAGGLMVPLNKEELMIDLIYDIGFPVILVARSTLGTINHTLLSLELLRARGIPVLGIIMNGPKSIHNRQALFEYGDIPILAEIDKLFEVKREALLDIKPNYDIRDLDDMAFLSTIAQSPRGSRSRHVMGIG